MKYCAYNPERLCDTDCVANITKQIVIGNRKYQQQGIYCNRGNFLIKCLGEEKEVLEHHKYIKPVFKEELRDET